MNMRQSCALGLSVALLVPLCAAASAAPPPPPPPKVGRQMSPVPPPANAPHVVRLFAGKAGDMADNWVKYPGSSPADWPVSKGVMTVGKGSIASRERFTDFHLHLELRTPWMPDQKGQGRGNSGVFLQGRYEIQVLDSYGLPDPGTGDCGAMYGQAAPLQNACRPPTAWQSFDYYFRAPRFDASGTVLEEARVTVVQNGLVVQNNLVMKGANWGETFGKLSAPGPILLQDHHNAVQYRNIWVVPLPLKGADHY